MKKNLAKMLRNVLAMLLVACMVVGFIPSVVFAQTESEPEAKKYVSLGDSMTNGYGLEGYDSVGRVNGFLEEVPSAYPAMLAEKYGWDLTQLATSAMRAEDLHFILEYGRKDDAYQGDYYTQDEFVNNRWNDYEDINNDYAGVENVAKVFQNAIAEADVISMAVGNSNFGVFLLGRIMDALGIFLDEDETPESTNAGIAFENALVECNEETKAFAMELYATVQASAADVLPEGLPAELLARVITYGFVSYALNFAGSIEAIVELNPDAEIIIVGLMNNYAGVKLSYNGEIVDLGELMGKAIDFANVYLSGLPAVLQKMGKYPEATFYYAAAESVAVIVDNFADEIYGDNAVRVRTIEQVVSMVWPMLNGMNIANGDEPMYVNITRAEVEAYEAAYAAGPEAYAQLLAPVITGDQAALKKLQSITTYLAFEKAIIEGAQLDVMEGNAFLTLVAGLDGIFDGVYGQFEDNIADRMTNDDELQNFAVQALVVIEDDMRAKGLPIPNGYIYDDPKAIAKVCLLVALPDAMSDALVADDTLLTLLSLFARMLIGNGIGCHPSAKGHESLFNAVVDAYDAKHTVQDETEKNTKIALDALYNLLKECGPDAAAAVWAQWEAQGYVAAVETSINDLIEAAKARYTYYTEEALPSIDAAVVELNATNDALVVELAALNAQLAAKEAELAEVLKNQEIGSVTLPNINIDATLGGNTPTEVPDHDCEGEVAELEAAIADLKHAIAVTEALIADVSADIADMVALAEQIADAIAELSKTVKQIVAAGEDLLAAFNAVKDVLTNGSATTVDATKRAFEAARTTAVAAADVLNLVVDNANAITADIAALAADLVVDAEALLDRVINDIPASVAKTPDEVKAAVGAALLAAKLARALGAEDYAKAELDELLAKADAEYDTKKKELEARAEELKGEIADLEAKIAAHIEEKFPVAAEYAEAEYAAAIVELEARAEELNEELMVWTAELDKALVELAGETAETIEAAVAPIKAQIARVEKDLATINADLACACAHLDAVLAAIYDEAVAEAAALYAAAKAEYEVKKAEVLAELAALEAEAAAKLAELKAELEAAIADATAKYEEAKAALESHVEEKLAELKAELEAAIADATAKYEAAKAALEAEVAAKKAALEAALKAAELKVKDTAAKLDAAVKNAYETVVAEANRIYGEALMAAKNELKKVVDTLENLPGYIAAEVNSALAAALKNALSKLANLIGSKLPGMNNSIFEDMSAAVLDKLTELGIAGINGLLGYNGTADLVVGEGFTYVALGDGSAEPKSYVEKLAALLDAEAKANGVSGINYVNAAVSGNTVAAERANLTAAVKDADLITLGFSNVTFLANALNAGLGQTEAEFDWVALVGEQGAAYVADLLADVQLEVANSGVTGMAADIINTTIEALAYYTIEYVVELPNLISDIKAVNPDAVIAVIGMYNPLKDVVITLDGSVGVEVSEYVDYLVNGVTLFGNAYSLLSGDCIFVQVGDVATENDKAELNIYDLIMMVKEDFASLNPSEAGHETILAALAAALNISYYVEPEMGLLGDADGDGVVGLADAQVIMQAYVGEDVAINLNVCDLDGDGVVGLLDAQLIMQWYVGDIANFPVEQ